MAYRRYSNVQNILDICSKNGISKIYVALDWGRDPEAFSDVQKCRKVVEDFSDNFEGHIYKKYAEQNLGCAISVLSACDWVFSHEDFATVIEDDCIPSDDFFQFMQDSQKVMKFEPRIGIACGTQFASIEKTNNSWFLASYPLIWGWGTSRRSWEKIRDGYFKENMPGRISSFRTYAEYCYWKSGARRAYSGFVDAWDIPLVFVLICSGLKALLPGVNLIKNVGNDAAATHTLTDSQWLNNETSSYNPSSKVPVENILVDTWLSESFYGISLRHIFSTKVTRLKDLVSPATRIREPLLDRWRQRLIN